MDPTVCPTTSTSTTTTTTTNIVKLKYLPDCGSGNSSPSLINLGNLCDEVKDAVMSWIKDRRPALFTDLMRILVHRFEKCIAVNGDLFK